MTTGKTMALIRDPGSIPRLGRSPREGNGNPLQYSCLENSMDGGAWWATVHGVTKSWTRLSDFMTQLHESLQQRFKQDPELLMGDVLPKTT